jgi:chorismate mutase/prephenate dehydratase
MTDEDRLRVIRDRIDTIDRQLLALLNERVARARDIGLIKAESGNPAVYRPEREAQILRRLTELNDGPLDNDSLVRLYREIMSIARAAEAPVSVAMLGPEGTYSHAAALKQFGRTIEAVPCASIDEVFRQVEAGAARYGVVPVENSTEGGVNNTLDCLVSTPLRICGEILLRIHHCLFGHSADYTDVSRLYGHEQALAQCRHWIGLNLPNVETVAVASNAEAVRIASGEGHAAAIAGELAQQFYDLPVVTHNIEDQPGNTTRFLVIGDQEVSASGYDKTSLLLSARNRPGALYGLLQPLSRQNIDMTRIESRPSRTGLWEYVFFVDFAGHVEDGPVRAAVAELERAAALYKLLGSYPRASR